MVYKDLRFKKSINRPFFYTSFVSTVDGKVQVNGVDKEGYWPIGSKTDYDIFTFLRAHADAIIDGKNTARRFGKNTIETINSRHFKKLRKNIGKTKEIEYIVATKNLDAELKNVLENPFGLQPTIFAGNIDKLVAYLNGKKLNTVFIDGGPNLLASFLEKDLIDEVFLTIAPKIFGNSKNAAITMVEGKLFSKENIKKLHLISVDKVENEVFLHYQLEH